MRIRNKGNFTVFTAECVCEERHVWTIVHFGGFLDTLTYELCDDLDTFFLAMIFLTFLNNGAKDSGSE